MENSFVGVMNRKVLDIIYPINVYKQEDDSKKIQFVAVLSRDYFGASIVGTAKWDGEGEFKEHYGISLAVARCVKKIILKTIQENYKSLTDYVRDLNMLTDKLEGLDRKYALNVEARKNKSYKLKRYEVTVA